MHENRNIQKEGRTTIYMRLIWDTYGASEYLQEVVRRWKIDCEVKLLQSKFLHCYHLSFLTRIVSHVDKVFYCGWVDLLVFRCNYHSCNSQQLHFMPTNLPSGQEPVSKIYCNVERFCLKSKANMNVNQPINQNSSHVFINFKLVCHVVHLWIKLRLFISTPGIDVVCMFDTVERHPWYRRITLRSVSPKPAWVNISNVLGPWNILDNGGFNSWINLSTRLSSMEFGQKRKVTKNLIYLLLMA